MRTSHLICARLTRQVGAVSQLLGMELSHISGARIAQEASLPDISDLVEILATMLRKYVSRKAIDRDFRLVASVLLSLVVICAHVVDDKCVRG